jgi:hypothetical protein
MSRFATMTLYFAARLLHVFGAFGLFVALGVEWAGLFHLSRSRSADDVRRSLEALGLGRKIGPAALVSTLAAGMYMATVAEAWALGWTRVAMGSIVLVALVGGLVTGRRTAALDRLASSGEHSPFALRARIDDPWLWSSLLARAGILAGVVVLMATKPGIAGSLVTITVALAAGLVASLPKWLDASEWSHR